MDVIFPKGTPRNVKDGVSQFVNKELMIKAINEAGMNARYVSTHVFANRGEGKARNKVGDWLKYRYPAKNEDLKAVWQFIDLPHKYDWHDFCFTDYQSKTFRKILFIYHGYALRKSEEKKDAKLRAILGKGSTVTSQMNLFEIDEKDRKKGKNDGKDSK